MVLSGCHAAPDMSSEDQVVITEKMVLRSRQREPVCENTDREEIVSTPRVMRFKNCSGCDGRMEGWRIGKIRNLRCAECESQWHPACAGITGLMGTEGKAMQDDMFYSLFGNWQCPDCVHRPACEPTTIPDLSESEMTLTRTPNMASWADLGGKSARISPGASSTPVVKSRCTCQGAASVSIELIREIVSIVKAELLKDNQIQPRETNLDDRDDGEKAANENSDSEENVSVRTYADQVTRNMDTHQSEWKTVERKPRKATNPPPPQPQHRIILKSTNSEETAERAKELLADIPVRRSTVRDGRVTLEFREKAQHENAHKMLKGALSADTKIQASETAKVSVLNVPVPEIEDAAARQYVFDGLRRKNECLQTTEFAIVYFKRHVRNPALATIGLRVTPSVRDQLLNQGTVYFELGRYRVEKRVFYRQCFHCQAPGHVAERCPKIESPPTCMFCSGAHVKDDCPVKGDTTKHNCANCKSVKHHGGYQGCPVLLKFADDLSKNYNRV